MMKWQAMFPGTYLTAAEFGDKKPTLTIADTRMVKLPQDDGTEKDRGALFFRETPRAMVLNKSNAQAIAALFGDDTRNWVGKRLTLYATQVRVGPKMELGIRVFGSPDIDRPLQVVIKLAKRKPQTITLVPTGKPAQQPAQEQEPGKDGPDA